MAVMVVPERVWRTWKKREEAGVIVPLLLLLFVVVVRGVGGAASALARLRSKGSWKWVGKARRS